MKCTKYIFILLIIAVVLSFAGLQLLTPGISVYAEENQNKAEYLIDENFSFLKTASNSTNVQISGWDTRAAGGSLSYQYYSWLKISDTSNILPVSLNKKFNIQYGGKITLEYRFKPAKVIDGLKWQLRNGSTVGLNVFTKDANLYVDTPGGTPKLLQAYAANVEYGVKVIADISQNVADIYINGILKASNVGFKNSISSLDNLNISTGEASTGDLYLYTVKIYKGYTVNEKFISTLANLPRDWSSSASGGTIAVEKLDNAAPPDSYSLKMDATNSTAAMTFGKSISAQSGAQVFEYKVLFPDETDGLSAELLNGNTGILKLVTLNGKLCFINENGQSVPVYDYITNIWYSIKIKYNASIGKADIYINSKLVKDGAELITGNTNPNTVRFSTSAENKGIMYLDDIQLYSDLPLPSDYVPAPQKVPSKDILVGTQSCSLWREGTHYGWDLINPYPDRTPLLGYYDEGNPETADWEIKWMAEHGINFQMFAWFRDKGSAVEGKPIKDPDASAALNRGYLNAKYSDLVDFTIMWENGASTAKSSADFRNNIVPYWIEYYLKDSRYLVVDNKPVISIYTIDGLKRDFGTIENIKAETDYLRSEVKKLGFEDAILLISHSKADPVTMSECKAAGFDAIFDYSWGSYSGYPEIQKINLQKQRDAGTMDMVPVISMGRDDSAWGGSPGYYSTPNEFQSVAQWVQDTFIPSLPDTSPGKKMVLLDNWNEYGEGHFIAPTTLYGFGYLDAIRNVFTADSSHEDALPTQEQKDRVGVMYPKGRVLPRANTAYKPELTDIYTIKWEFNTNGNTEGWGSNNTKFKDIANINIADGSMSFNSIGTDPWIVSPDNLGLSADENPYIHIRMKNGCGDPNGRIYFITETDQTWNNAKSVSVYISPNSQEYSDNYAAMWTNPKWTGNVKAIRFDPVNVPGSISIDSIGIIYSPMTGIKTYFDGQSTKLPNQAKVIDGSVMVPIEDVYSKLSIPNQWNDNNDTFIAVKSGSIIELIPGQTKAYKDGAPIDLEHQPVFSNGVLYAPASFLKQAFGYIVSWNEQDQELYIYTAALTWNFKADEGWTANESIVNGRIADGYYLGTSTVNGSNGVEAYITSRDKLNMDAASVKRIRINYMNSNPGNELKLYFTTTNDSVWNTNKMMTLPAVAYDNNYREYVFDTSSFSGWNGIIKQIRIVPTNKAGDFGVDYIQLDITSSITVIGENLVKDPGMELGTSTDTINRASILEYSAAQAHSGNQSAKITKQSTYGNISFINLPLINGQEYSFSAWMKLDPNSASLLKNPPQYPITRFCLEYVVNKQTKQMVMYSNTKPLTTDWQKAEWKYTINESSPVTAIRMYIYTDQPATTDTFYIDDVEIRPVSYTASPAWVYVSEVSLDKTAATIEMGKTQVLTATVQPVDAINKAVKWSSDNTDVAIVDQNGYVYAKSEGIANITATTVEGGHFALCKVVIDETAPVTTATVLGSVYCEGTYNSHVAVKLISDDTTRGSGVAGIQYSLDGINWMAYTAPLELTDNGTYSISYRAADNAGNVEAVKNISFKISMTPDVMVSYLKEYVNTMPLDEGIKKSLISKLDNILNSLEDVNMNSSVNKLNAFLNEADAQNGKKITVEQVDKIKTEAVKILKVLLP